MSGRYALLRSDLVVAEADGGRQGDRDALDAVRLGLPFDSWPGLDVAARNAGNAVGRAGVSWDLLSPNAKAQVLSAWIDGYRPAYAEAYFGAEEAEHGDDDISDRYRRALGEAQL